MSSEPDPLGEPSDFARRLTKEDLCVLSHSFTFQVTRQVPDQRYLPGTRRLLEADSLQNSTTARIDLPSCIRSKPSLI